MFSIRRLVVSLVAGGLALTLAAGSAVAAEPDPALSMHGFELGLAAAEARLADGEDGFFDGEKVRVAMAVIDDLVQRKIDGAEATGNGPVQAAAVLAALESGTSPSQVAPGSTVSALAVAVDGMKGPQGEAKAAEKSKKPDDPPGRP